MFFTILLDDRRIQIRIQFRTSYLWIRIRDAQKHTDPTDPNPQLRKKGNTFDSQIIQT
jgi:hypothetical protein